MHNLHYNHSSLGRFSNFEVSAVFALLKYVNHLANNDSLVVKFHSKNFIKSSSFYQYKNAGLTDMEKTINSAKSKSISDIFFLVDITTEWKSRFCRNFGNVIVKKTVTNAKFHLFSFNWRKSKHVVQCNSLLKLIKIIFWRQRQK